MQRYPEELTRSPLLIAEEGPGEAAYLSFFWRLRHILRLLILGSGFSRLQRLSGFGSKKEYADFRKQVRKYPHDPVSS